MFPTKYCYHFQRVSRIFWHIRQERHIRVNKHISRHQTFIRSTCQKRFFYSYEIDRNIHLKFLSFIFYIVDNIRRIACVSSPDSGRQARYWRKEGKVGSERSRSKISRPQRTNYARCYTRRKRFGYINVKLWLGNARTNAGFGWRERNLWFLQLDLGHKNYGNSVSFN